jgi:hypothetical protein
LSAAGSLTAVAVSLGAIKSGASSLTGSASVSATGSNVIYAEFGGVDTEITRITEDGNTRVTEDSNVRITFELTNSGVSSITPQPTFILFSSTAYIKENGVWKIFDPYAKYEGSWVEPEKVYYKEGTSWRRAH